MGNENVVHIHNRVLFSCKKMKLCHLQETGDLDKLNKPGSNKYHVFCHTQNPEFYKNAVQVGR
jgi:hypothetical protein